MKINSDSPDFQNRIDSTNSPATGDRLFGDALAAKSTGASPAANSSLPLASIAQSLSKSDLADPSKANAAVDRAVHELMDREFGGMVALDREKVASWLRSDPMIREALLKQLSSLAS